jgi:CRP/FNR family cyclic AMP-dependent transcriptional regulator
MEDSRHAIKLMRRTTKLPPVPPNAGESGPPLPHVGIFAGLSVQSLKNLAAYGTYEIFPAGTEIVREGAKQDRLHVVVSGRLALTAKRGAKNVPVSEAHAGECLGEVSLLEPGPASATIKVTEEAVLWSLDITGLRIFISDHSGGAGALLMGMASCLSARLRESNLRICEHHMMPVETLPKGRERAITASNAPIQPGFFERIKQTIAIPIPQKKVRISTKIKM